MTDLGPGSVFAGYRIEDLAGRGGMGVVYRATDLNLERTVALKLISAALSGNEAFRRRFVNESKVAASIEHPNVIPIFGAGEHEDRLYLAMRYIDDPDLRDEIAGQGPLPPGRAVRIATQVASALDTAHARGLVHRDVKPANVLLAPGDHAYLTDFGLTKRLRADPDETMTGNLLGTLDYVAPEQIKGEEVGACTDVYALGCVLFHALSGEAPFAALEREGKLWAHVNDAPPPLGPGAPAAFDRVIARAMAKNPAERFGSAGDLAEAAAEALVEAGGQGERSPAPGPGAAAAAISVSSPPQSGGYRRALLTHALVAPFSLALLGGTLIAGVVFGLLPEAVPLALLIYGIAATVVYLDQDVRQEVLGRERAKRGDGKK